MRSSRAFVCVFSVAILSACTINVDGAGSDHVPTSVEIAARWLSPPGDAGGESVGEAKQRLLGSWASTGEVVLSTPLPNNAMPVQYSGPGQYLLWYEQYTCGAGTCPPWLRSGRRMGYWNNLGRKCQVSMPIASVGSSPAAVSIVFSAHSAGPNAAPEQKILGVLGIATLPALDPASPNRNEMYITFPQLPRHALNGLAIQVSAHVDCGDTLFDAAAGEAIYSGFVETHGDAFWYGSSFVNAPYTEISPWGVHSFSSFAHVDGVPAYWLIYGAFGPNSSIAYATGPQKIWVQVVIN